MDEFLTESAKAKLVTTRVAVAVLGGLAMVAGITGGILAHEHHKAILSVVRLPGGGIRPAGTVVYTGWSMTAYDVVRIGAWALLIFGAIAVLFALMREFKARG